MPSEAYQVPREFTCIEKRRLCAGPVTFVSPFITVFCCCLFVLAFATAPSPSLGVTKVDYSSLMGTWDYDPFAVARHHSAVLE